jgi:hypothetical protein
MHVGAPQGVHVPPQSIPVSVPFCTPSVQLALRHVPAAHAPLAQSLAAVQRLPGGQGLHVPPQSTSVSLPFFTASAHPAI